MKTYVVIRISRRYAGRRTVTRETPVATLPTLAAVLTYAAAHGATPDDLDEIQDELESMGVSGWKGYAVIRLLRRCICDGNEDYRLIRVLINPTGAEGLREYICQTVCLYSVESGCV